MTLEFPFQKYKDFGHIYIGMQMFIVVLFTITSNWKQTRSPLTSYR